MDKRCVKCSLNKNMKACNQGRPRESWDRRWVKLGISKALLNFSWFSWASFPWWSLSPLVLSWPSTCTLLHNNCFLQVVNLSSRSLDRLAPSESDRLAPSCLSCIFLSWGAWMCACLTLAHLCMGECLSAACKPKVHYHLTHPTRPMAQNTRRLVCVQVQGPVSSHPPHPPLP